METSKAVEATTKNYIEPLNLGSLPTEELERLTNIFSLLIKIDQRNKKVKKNDNI